MLILTRGIGESLRIGEDIAVEVLGIKGNQVRIGITAPKTVPVRREEILEDGFRDLPLRRNSRDRRRKAP